MTVVYIDRVFFLNWIIDYLLLLTTARLSGAPLHRLRLLLCAAGGGLYAAAVFFPQGSFLGHPIIRLLAGAVMTLSAYWPAARRWRLMALFFLLSGALAGIVLAAGLMAGSAKTMFGRLYYAQISWPLLLTTAALLYLLLHLVFRQGARHGGGELMTITVSVNRHSRQLLALHDTGNTLRDPVTGRAVLVMEQEALYDVWHPSIESILKSSMAPEEKMVQLYAQGIGSAFTLLPFRSVGVASGLLLAVRSDYIKVGRFTYPKTLIALSEGPVSDGGAYQALWGGMERGETHDQTAADHPHLDQEAQQAG